MPRRTRLQVPTPQKGVKMKFVFEKREASASEKAHGYVLDAKTNKIYEPRYLGKEEAEKRLPKFVYPIAYVSTNNYIPVRFRSENFLVK